MKRILHTLLSLFLLSSATGTLHPTNVYVKNNSKLFDGGLLESGSAEYNSLLETGLISAATDTETTTTEQADAETSSDTDTETAQNRIWTFFAPSFGCTAVCNVTELTEWSRVNQCCSPSHWVPVNETVKVDSSGKGTVLKKSYPVVVRGRYLNSEGTIEAIDMISKNSYGNLKDTSIGYYATSPLIFPGEWIKYSDFPQTIRDGWEANDKMLYNLFKEGNLIKSFYGEDYFFNQHFVDYSVDLGGTQLPVGTNTRTTPVSDLALPPVAPAGYEASTTDVTQLQQQAKDQQADVPTNLIQAGSFATITNQLPVSYQVKDQTLPELVGNGTTTNVATNWALTTFAQLWNGSKTIAFEPKDDPNYPTFTFKFNENTKTISIERSSAQAQAGTTWSINLVPLSNFLSSEGLPMPKSLTLSFTIDADWNIIIDQLTIDSFEYAVNNNAVQETKTSYTFNAQSTEKVSAIDAIPTADPTTVTTGNAAGGLCGIGILLANNPTCSINN